jgi:hypothetical protein
MIKNIIILVLTLIIIALPYLDSEPEATVTTPEVTKSGGYLRPVREGNCWRQYIGQGDRDSILVCG